MLAGMNVSKVEKKEQMQEGIQDAKKQRGPFKSDEWEKRLGK